MRFKRYPTHSLYVELDVPIRLYLFPTTDVTVKFDDIKIIWIDFIVRIEVVLSKNNKVLRLFNPIQSVNISFAIVTFLYKQFFLFSIHIYVMQYNICLPKLESTNSEVLNKVFDLTRHLISRLKQNGQTFFLNSNENNSFNLKHIIFTSALTLILTFKVI